MATDQLIYFPYTKSDIDDWLEIKEEINSNDKDNIEEENRMTRLNNMKAKVAHPLPEQTTILIDMGRESQIAVATITQINIKDKSFIVHHLGGIKRNDLVTWRARFFS